MEKRKTVAVEDYKTGDENPLSITSPGHARGTSSLGLRNSIHLHIAIFFSFQINWAVVGKGKNNCRL